MRAIFIYNQDGVIVQLHETFVGELWLTGRLCSTEEEAYDYTDRIAKELNCVPVIEKKKAVEYS